MDSFIINGKIIAVNKLLHDTLAFQNRTSFEISTLTFIKNWLCGQKEFSIKTSGSTGSPKLVNVTREQMINSALRTIDTLKLSPGDSTLACLDPAFIAGMMMIVRAIVGKLDLIIIAPRANPLSDINEKIKINFIALTPNQVDQAIEHSVERLNQINTVLIGGAAIHPDLENKLRELQPQIIHSYAMTETLSHVALRILNGSKASSIYRAMEGVSFEQDDRECLIIHDQWLGFEKLVTNDVIELIDEKSFRWLGRYDNVINSGGIKIQMEEIEKKIKLILKDLGSPTNFCLLSRPDPKLTQKMVLLIERGRYEIDRQVLKKELKNQLPKFHDPKEIVLVPKIVYTETGKVDRNKNAELYKSNL